MSFYKLIFITTVFIAVQNDFVVLKNEETTISSNKDYTEVILLFTIKPGYHIQSNEEVPENIIPTSITFETSQSYRISLQELIVPVYDTVVLDETPHMVISDEFQVKVHLRSLNAESSGSNLLKGILTYQACDDKKCYFPRELKFEIGI